MPPKTKESPLKKKKRSIKNTLNPEKDMNNTDIRKFIQSMQIIQ